MKFRRQKKADSSINLTPLIDVVFLLLIFFMVSTTFTKETHLVVQLPEADGQPAEMSPEFMEILITRDGGYSLNGKTLVNSKMETLMKAMRGESAGNTDMPVVITADAQASHQAVVTAMDASGRLGFVKLQITSLEPQE